MRYYRARPKKDSNQLIAYLPHRIDLISREEYEKYTSPTHNGVLKPEIIAWCNINFGDAFTIDSWAYGIMTSKVTLYFKTKEDAVAFKLRWAV